MRLGDGPEVTRLGDGRRKNEEKETKKKKGNVMCTFFAYDFQRSTFIACRVYASVIS